MEEFDTLDISEKTIAVLGDRWWPHAAKQEGDRTRSTIDVPHFRYYVSDRRGSLIPYCRNANLDFGNNCFVDLGHGIIRRGAF